MQHTSQAHQQRRGGAAAGCPGPLHWYRINSCCLHFNFFVLGQFVSGFGVWATCKWRLGEPGKKGAGGNQGLSVSQAKVCFLIVIYWFCSVDA